MNGALKPETTADAAEAFNSVRREKLILSISLKLLVVVSSTPIRTGRRQVICDLSCVERAYCSVRQRRQYRPRRPSGARSPWLDFTGAEWRRFAGIPAKYLIS